MASTVLSRLTSRSAVLGSLTLLSACAAGPVAGPKAPTTPTPVPAPAMTTGRAAAAQTACTFTTPGRRLVLALVTARIQPKQQPALQRVLQEFGQTVAQWDGALQESGFAAGLTLASLPAAPPPPRRRGDQAPPCPNADTLVVEVTHKGVRLSPATARPAQWRGWDLPSGTGTTSALLLAYLPKIVGASPAHLLMTTAGQFAGLRPARIRPLAVDTSGQAVTPALTATIFALPMLSPTDSVEVRATRQQVTVLHFTGGTATRRSMLRESRSVPRGQEPAEWRPAKRRQTYPIIKWGWTPVGDTVIVAASLTRPGTERVLRTLIARQP